MTTLIGVQPNECCDRCIQHAVVLVRLPSDQALVFCGHHFHVNQAKLRETATEIVDSREPANV